MIVSPILLSQAESHVMRDNLWSGVEIGGLRTYLEMHLVPDLMRLCPKTGDDRVLAASGKNLKSTNRRTAYDVQQA